MPLRSVDQGETHLHIHLGEADDNEPNNDEPYEEIEGEEGEGEPSYKPEESVEELCQKIEEIAAIAGRLAMGSEGTQRRQHTRDTRSVPTPSEVSDVIPDLPPAERRRVIADGAELLRQKTIAERAYLSDFSDALSDYWNRQLEEDKRNRR
jgi:hypothetical protein